MDELQILGTENGTDNDTLLTGTFIGVGDDALDAQGIAKVIPLENGGNVLRLEVVATNGPDLYVYLSTDKSASVMADKTFSYLY
jgi:hypothetical protein